MDKWVLKASFPFESNDPLEYVAQYTEHKIGRFLDSHSPQDEPLPFFSFSRKMSDVTMWGQYADYARGACLVFKFPLSENSREYWADENADSLPLNIHLSSTESDSERDITLGGVKYSEERFSPGNPIEEKPGTDFLISIISWKICQMPIIKAESWRYEDEVRIIEQCSNASRESDGMLFYEWPMDYLIGVIVGSNSPYPASYIWQKIRLNYEKTKKTNYFWKENFACIVVRASIHPKKFVYEAFPFGDRMETALFEKIKDLKVRSYEESLFWHDKINKMHSDLSAWRNSIIRDFMKKLAEQNVFAFSKNKESEEEMLFDIMQNIFKSSSIYKKICRGDALKTEDIQAALPFALKEKEQSQLFSKFLIDNDFETFGKEIYLGVEKKIDSIVSDCFHETNQDNAES